MSWFWLGVGDRTSAQWYRIGHESNVKWNAMLLSLSEFVGLSSLRLGSLS